MADFTAVIRRAVEGLPEQSPELRARVYEKARSAVIRQMENMSPPPPEALIKRQIDKIDAAIAEVESEFAEALPPGDETPAEEPVAEERTEAPPEGVPAEEPAPEHEDQPAPGPDETRSAWQDDAASHDGEPADDRGASDASYPEEEPDAAGVHGQSYAEEPVDEDHVHGEPERPDYAHETVADGWVEDDTRPEAAEAGPRNMLHGATFELVHTPDRVEYEEEGEDEEAYSYDVTDEPLETEAGTVVVEPDEDAGTWDDARREPEDDWQFEATTAKAGGFEAAPPPPRRSVPEKDWAHVDSLLGLEPEEPGEGFDDYDELSGNPAQGGFEDAETDGRRRIVLIAGAVVVALVLVVGGIFAWINRDSIVAAISPADQQPTTAETEQPPATTVEQTAEPEEAEVADNAKPYTQRLLPDGTEVDEGLPAEGAASGPARSVANQTSASTAPETASTAQTADPAPPVGAAQKMYLYEEQLGQSVPSAFQGTVEWELKQENTGTAVSEPVVEGVISVPDAGLSGVLTFRRNDDPSLPASHLIDIAFTLDDNFEGGAIDNVQRISMKGTEAARGDPLIAVSAKITDDLYMLALNDFDQARAQNLALLGDRNWIDIPVTYRNGRRALLTLEKGTTGMAIFDRAIQEWRALGDINSGN